MNIKTVVAKLEQMTVNQLQGRFAEVFGEEPRGRNKRWLIRRIAWRIQANEEGGLSERARRRALELADFADLRLTAPNCSQSPTSLVSESERKVGSSRDPRLPAVGTVLTRKYKGEIKLVEVQSDGFCFEGKTYRSLSAVAKAITGSRWNGYLFFGLTKREKN